MFGTDNDLCGADQQDLMPQFRHTPGQPFNDPAIMSASFASPMPSDARYGNPMGLDSYAAAQHQHHHHHQHQQQQAQLAYGPPPGIAYPPPGLSPSPSQVHMGNMGNVDMANGEYDFRSVLRGESPRSFVPSTERRAFSVRKYQYRV